MNNFELLNNLVITKSNTAAVSKYWERKIKRIIENYMKNVYMYNVHNF